MPGRCHFLTRIIQYKAILICVVLLSLSTVVCAESYQVPQTAEVTLAWDANEPAPEGYYIYQRTEGQAYDYSQPIWTTAGTTATLYNLAYDTTYYYVVRAYVGNDTSGDSNEVSFSCPSSSSTGSDTYTLTAAVSGSGTISPAGTVTVTQGADQSFVLSPDSGSYLVDVIVDGTSVGAVASYTFANVSKNHTIDAEFASLRHTISASSGYGGAISPSDAVIVTHGAQQGYVITPDTGYHINDVVVDGISQGPLTGFLFDPVVQDHTIHASFALDAYTIISSADSGGMISPFGAATIAHGTQPRYVITPDTGYHVNDVAVDGFSQGPLTDFLFDPVVQNHSIHASFLPNEYTISSSAGTGGAITPSGYTVIAFGGSQTYTISANAGYSIADVIADGLSVGIMDSYTFSAIDADHSLNVRFVADNEAPVADAGPDQTVDEGQPVTLSGLNSIDPDDGIAAFQWRQVQGVDVLLNSPAEPDTTFTAPNVDESGTALVFELTVTDYKGIASVDRCIINVTWINRPPSAEAGADQTVTEGSHVGLDASHSTDADDGIASYAWKQLRGPVVALSNPTSATPGFIAPDVGTQGDGLMFEVTVTDTGGLQDTDNSLVNVTWVNVPPVANAGPDQEAAVGDEVHLDGSQSHDADDAMVASCTWRQTKGAPVTLSDTTALQPVFIVPSNADDANPLTFELTVTDSGGLHGTDVCEISVRPTDSILSIFQMTTTLDQKEPAYQAHAYVTIIDGSGNRVAKARVSGKWYINGDVLNTASADTGSDGVARLDSDTLEVEPGGVFSVEITDIVKEGYSYDLTSNTAETDPIPEPEPVGWIFKIGGCGR